MRFFASRGISEVDEVELFNFWLKFEKLVRWLVGSMFAKFFEKMDELSDELSDEFSDGFNGSSRIGSLKSGLVTKYDTISLIFFFSVHWP